MKKPNKLPIRWFVQRIQQLKGYLDLLPCLFYLERATKLTKVVQAFNDVDLASHILRMVPRNWQDQYKLTGGTVPQSVCKLLEALECIKKAYPTKKEWKGPMSNVAGGGTFKKGWSLSVTRSPRSPSRKQNTVRHSATSEFVLVLPVPWDHSKDVTN